MYLKLDGIIVAPSNITSWSNPKSQTWISFSGVPGLMIDGSGTINGRGSSFWEVTVCYIICFFFFGVKCKRFYTIFEFRQKLQIIQVAEKKVKSIEKQTITKYSK